MKKKLFLVLALCTLGAVAVQAQTTLFETTNTSTPYRIPAITTAKNGHIIAISDYRLDKRDIGYGEVDMYARISTDNGNNWGSAALIADGTGTSGSFDCGFGDAAIVADRERNEILIMCVAGNQVFSDGTSSKHNHMARIKATYNETEKKWEWTSPADVTEQFLGASTSLLPNAYTMFIASGRMVQSNYKAEGSNYYRVYAALLVKDSSSSYKNYVIYTDDFGTSWSLLGSTVISGGDEAKVEELPNGDIVISSRATGGRIFNVYSMSEATWGTKQAYTFASSAEACNGEIMLYKNLYKVGETSGQTYDVLLQSLPTASSRGNLKVFYQAVNTSTTLATLTATNAWKEGKIVDSGNAAYSTMAIQNDGKIGFLYEDDYTVKSLGLFKGNYDYANIVYIPYTIEELTGNTYTTTAPVVTPVNPEVSLTAANSTLTVGETTQLTFTTNSGGAVAYTSNNPAVATVDGNGVVTAVAAGTATITATVAETDKYNTASASCEITVNAADGGGDDGSGEGGDDSGDDTGDAKTYELKLLNGKIGAATFHLVTFSAAEAVKVPNGVKAYYVKATDSENVKLTRVSGSVIPAEAGVILMGTGSDSIVTLTVTTEAGTALNGNLLKGTLDEVKELNSTDYILAVKGSGDLKGQFAFCQIPKNNYPMDDYANRAYLSLGATFATRSITLSFDGEEGGATAIDEVEAVVDTPAEYYTLQGVRVEGDKLTPGIYIMKHHGKTRKVKF